MSRSVGFFGSKSAGAFIRIRAFDSVQIFTCSRATAPRGSAVTAKTQARTARTTRFCVIIRSMATLSYRTAGESHGKAMLALVEGMPAGAPVDSAFIDNELRRR